MRRIFGFLLPSVVAACLGGAITGVVEGLMHTSSLIRVLASAGFYSAASVPVLFLAGLIVRGLWRAWSVNELVAAVTNEHGSAPRLAAWVAYVLVASWLVFAVEFNVVRQLVHSTSSRDVVSLSTALVSVALVLALIAVSRPAVRLLNVVFERLDTVAGRCGILTARRIVLLGAVAASAMTVGGWYISIRPRLGHVEVTPLIYVGFMVALVSAATWLWPTVARGKRGAALASAASVGLVVATLVGAGYVRYRQPYAMLEIWGEVPLAGAAVDTFYNVQTLRGELHMDSFRPAERQNRDPGARHPDVVLITIDTVRADRTPLHNGPAKMPNLANVGKYGAVFRWAFSPSNVTRRSLPAMATGLAPARVHGRVAGWALRMDPRHVTVAERFRAAGYETVGFFCCGAQFAPRHRLGLIRGIDHEEIEYNGMKLSKQAAAWLRERRLRGDERPLFLWIHYIEPHRWDIDYKAGKHGGNARSRYDMSLAAVDDMLGIVLAEAWRKDRRDRTVLAITSDHGESLGDRGQKHHSSNLYNEQIRVPFVIAAPGVKPKRVEHTVSLVSLAPTLLDLAGFVPPGMPEMDGPSLGPLLRGTLADTPKTGVAYSAMIADRSIARGQRAVVSGEYKLIEKSDGRLELYDLTRDRKERHNLAGEKPELLARMKALLEVRTKTDRIRPF